MRHRAQIISQQSPPSRTALPIRPGSRPISSRVPWSARWKSDRQAAKKRIEQHGIGVHLSLCTAQFIWAPGLCASKSKSPCSISFSCVSRLRSVTPSSVSIWHRFCSSVASPESSGVIRRSRCCQEVLAPRTQSARDARACAPFGPPPFFRAPRAPGPTAAWDPPAIRAAGFCEPPPEPAPPLRLQRDGNTLARACEKSRSAAADGFALLQTRGFHFAARARQAFAEGLRPKPCFCAVLSACSFGNARSQRAVLEIPSHHPTRRLRRRCPRRCAARFQPGAGR